MRSRDQATGGHSLLLHAVESGRPEVYTWGRTALSVWRRRSRRGRSPEVGAGRGGGREEEDGRREGEDGRREGGVRDVWDEGVRAPSVPGEVRTSSAFARCSSFLVPPSSSLPLLPPPPRRCHRLPRYPSLPSDVKRRAREAGYTARLAPSFCDLARGCPAAGSHTSTSLAAAASGPQVHRWSHLPRRPSLLATPASSDDA